MLESAVRIPWDDPTEAVPAFVTQLAMPRTSSIANGPALGFVSYPADTLLAGRAREVSPLVFLLAGLFVVPCAYLAGE